MSVQTRAIRGGKRYDARVMVNGINLKKTFASLAEARKWKKAQKKGKQHSNGGSSFKGKLPTLGEVIKRYLEEVMPTKSKNSILKQTLILNLWKKRIGNLELNKITPKVLSEEKRELAREKTARGTRRSNATINAYLVALGHVLTIAVNEWELIPTNPMSKVRKEKVSNDRARFLTREERKRLLDECNESKSKSLYWVVLIALHTGMRLSEILNLRWNEVDLDKRLITLHKTKNGSKRVVPLTQKCSETLSRIKGESRDDKVFPRGGSDKGTISIRSAWETALKRSGVKDFRFHDLRHSAASYFIMSGCSTIELASVLGHKSLDMTKRYAHLSPKHSVSLADKMAEQHLD